MDQIHKLNVVHRYEKRSLLIAYENLCCVPVPN
jgi:hypothetical protein